MRINAYLLAGDPAWAAHSLQSYYAIADRIFVSFDATKRSWAGLPLRVDDAIEALRSEDHDGKLVLLPGDHTDPGRPNLELETEQRQHALDAASEGSDWVLQLDTDEIMQDPQTFVGLLCEADDHAAEALFYPLRDFYQVIGPGRYLEHCGRWWTTQSAYPGPLAVKSGTRLRHCRQADVPGYRADVSWHNTDPWHPSNTTVHRVIAPNQAVAHMSWVRTDDEMAAKTSTYGHATAYDWSLELARWRWRRQHPLLTMASAPFRRDPLGRFRIARLGVTRDAWNDNAAGVGSRHNGLG